MNAVVCHYGWNEKRIQELIAWAQKDSGRAVVVLEDGPALRSFDHPFIRHYSLSEESQEETFRRIAYEFLFVPFSFEGKKCERLERIQAEVNFFVSDYADQGVSLCQNILENLCLPLIDGRELFSRFAGKPAIVCGAGPSLAKANLRSCASSAVIIAGGAAVDALNRIAVKPHLIAHVDPDPKHTFSVSDTPVFCQLRTASRTLKKCKGPKLLFPGSGNFPLEAWMEGQLGLSQAPFDGGWTVGTFSAALAYYLGCDPIIFVGMDLSTSQQSLYAPGVTTSCAKEALVPAENTEGKTVYARLDWLLAREWIEEFVRRHPDRRWINASMGLSFAGMEHKKLSDIGLAPCPISLEAALKSEIETGLVHSQVKESVAKCHDLIEQLFTELQAIFPKTESGLTALLEHELAEQLFYEKALRPIWDVWKPIISRHNKNGAYGLVLNELILYRSVLQGLPKAERSAERVRH